MLCPTCHADGRTTNFISRWSSKQFEVVPDPSVEESVQKLFSELLACFLFVLRNKKDEKRSVLQLQVIDFVGR